LTWAAWRGDLTDDEWDRISDVVQPHSGDGRMGRPVKNDRRQIVDAILYVTATGCQWRALPARYPNWSTVHHYRLAWARDGTLERLAARLAEPPEGAPDARPRVTAPVTRPSTRDLSSH